MTSIEEVKARLTFASMVTMAPCGIGFLKATLLMVEVTTVSLQWRFAAMAQARSIQLSNCPPKRLLRLFVSFGNTICVITVRLSIGVLPCAMSDIFYATKLGDACLVGVNPSVFVDGFLNLGQILLGSFASQIVSNTNFDQ